MTMDEVLEMFADKPLEANNVEAPVDTEYDSTEEHDSGIFRLENGYFSHTTFYSDFLIAEKFGYDAIEDTFHRAFHEWKNRYVYLTELVIVLNLRCWYWSEQEGNTAEKYCKLYQARFERAKDYALKNLKGEQFQYFWNWTD